MRFLFEARDESACSGHGHLEVVDAKEQKEAVPRQGRIRGHQRRMIVCTPLMQTEQDRSVRIHNLTEVVVTWRRLGLTEKRLIDNCAPSQRAGTS